MAKARVRLDRTAPGERRWLEPCGARDNTTISSPSLSRARPRLGRRNTGLPWRGVGLGGSFRFLRNARVRDQGREFLAVIIPGSPQRPHFTGKAYIRVGPETEEASEEQFENLIAQRSSKVYEIQQWKGKAVSAEWMNRNTSIHVGPSLGLSACTVEDCNQFWVTLRIGAGPQVVHPLTLVDLSFDPQNDRLKLLLWKT